MSLIESLVLFVAIGIIAYTYAKKKRITQEAKLSAVLSNAQSQISKLQEELDRRANIVSKVETFVKTSKFIEPIATWKEDKIYKYIFNDGYLYEFDDIFTENNQKIGLDEDFLCFKQFCYKRVNNPVDFLNKFGPALGIIQH